MSEKDTLIAYIIEFLEVKGTENILIEYINLNKLSLNTIQKHSKKIVKI